MQLRTGRNWSSGRTPWEKNYSHIQLVGYYKPETPTHFLHFSQGYALTPIARLADIEAFTKGWKQTLDIALTVDNDGYVLPSGAVTLHSVDPLTCQITSAKALRVTGRVKGNGGHVVLTLGQEAYPEDEVDLTELGV